MSIGSPARHLPPGAAPWPRNRTSPPEFCALAGLRTFDETPAERAHADNPARAGASRGAWN